MKAIILAAGKSSRLYPLTKETPKCLLELSDGLSIIEYQILLLKELGINDINIVTGFQASKIKEKLENKATYFHYENYEATNNLHTLNTISNELNDECIIMFSDVIIAKDLFYECLKSNDDFNLIIDSNNVTEKTMRVVTKNNSITDIGSHISVANGDANFIGIAKYSKRAIKIIKRYVDYFCRNNNYIEDYYTIVLPEIAKNNQKINYTLNLNNYYWDEIDYLDDYNNVKKVFGDKRDLII